MVRVVQVAENGGPDVMQVADLPLPPPGKGEVQVEHRAIGLNYIDTYFRSGLYPASVPFVPGNEAAGVIAAVGPGVKGFRKGDRIAYVTTLGAYSAARNIPANMAVKLPAKVKFEEAAAVMLKGMTAEYLLHRTFKVKKGHTILVHAAAGGTGLILCQWARKLGATVIGTAGSEEKAKLAKKSGCHHVIDYNTENFVERVAKITKGRKCDVVYDGVGKATVLASLDCLKPFGMLVNFGSASGAPEPLNLGLLASKGSLVVTRPTLMTHSADNKTYHAMARNVLKAVEKKIIRIKVNHTFPLDKAADAHRALESRQTTGSTILAP